MAGVAADRVLAVGYVEEGTAPTGPQQYDAVVITPPTDRGDPCAALRERAPSR